MKLCVFQTICLSNIRSLFTVHSAMVYVIWVYRQPSTNPYDIYQRNCPKHVQFHAKINL